MNDLLPFLWAGWSLVKNSSGATIQPGSLLRVASEAVVSNRIVYTVAQPNSASTDFLRDYLVSGPVTINSASGSYGVAKSMAEGGFVRYRTGSGTPAAGEMWGPKHGQWDLEKGYFGFIIRGGNTTLIGNAVTVARQIGVEAVLGKTDAVCTAGNSVTVSVYSGTAGSETDTTMNVTGCFLRNGYVPPSCFVHVRWMNGLPYIADDHRSVIVKADADIAKGGTDVCSVYNNGSDTGDNILATATGAPVFSGKWATAWWEEKAAKWYVAPWECP